MPLDDNYILFFPPFFFLPSLCFSLFSLISFQNPAAALHEFIFTTVLCSLSLFYLDKTKSEKQREERNGRKREGVGGSRRDEGMVSWSPGMLNAVSFAPFSAVLCLVGRWFWYLLTRLEGPLQAGELDREMQRANDS
ncbi:hypothetical protein TRV_06217 [Trichophyton verrucosum HKI 0517]|uniref:Transmembrane protein n=1 Tax=Trichophyton verrucosum (strain HKI 0517) TaxID=663202 RepID=D4DGB3_TRIVH|nr:uncharacterized protein TRV_06217 [Trichophyton verrucosum HKI 0517]EFE39110.1 hypothetical protein TRV_06217 [Trichophyton verrucosum HKI 0517]